MAGYLEKGGILCLYYRDSVDDRKLRESEIEGDKGPLLQLDSNCGCCSYVACVLTTRLPECTEMVIMLFSQSDLV